MFRRRPKNQIPIYNPRKIKYKKHVETFLSLILYSKVQATIFNLKQHNKAYDTYQNDIDEYIKKFYQKYISCYSNNEFSFLKSYESLPPFIEDLEQQKIFFKDIYDKIVDLSSKLPKHKELQDIYLEIEDRVYSLFESV